VGNEPYWASINAGTYGDNCRRFVEAMKEVDPKIRIGAALHNELRDGPDKEGRGVAWNKAVIDTTRASIDFLSYHPYYPQATRKLVREADSSLEEGKNKEYISDVWFKAVVAGANQALADIREIWSKNNVPSRIGLVLSEYGIWPKAAYGEAETPAKEWSNVARALFDADLLMQLIKEAKSLNLTAATSWNLHANDQAAAIGNIWGLGNDWPTRSTRPQYYALKMLKDALASKRLVKADVTSCSPGTFSVGRLANINAQSVDYLEVLAAFPNTFNPTSLTLVVINRSIDKPFNATISYPGFGANSYKTMAKLGHNVNWTDHNEAHTGTEKPVNPSVSDPKKKALPGAGGFTFEPHSLTVLEFYAAQPDPQ
jgi:alpha-L-arabinofuranosidase